MNLYLTAAKVLLNLAVAAWLMHAFTAGVEEQTYDHRPTIPATTIGEQP